MTTPTGPIKFSDIQNEFGGSNPISISEYYKGGAYVSSSVIDGGYGTPPTSGTIHIANLRNLNKFTVNAFSAGLSNNSLTTGIRSATVTLNSDGTSSVSRSPTSNVKAGSNISCGPWGSPTTTGVGSSYWCKLVPGSYNNTTISGGLVNSVISISGASWTFTSTGASSEGFDNGGSVINVYSDAAGTHLVNSGSISWDVGYAP